MVELLFNSLIKMLVHSLENYFANPYSPTMEGIIDLYDYIMYFLILIFFFVFWLFSYIIYRYIFLLNSVIYLRSIAMLDWSSYFFFLYESLTYLEGLMTTKAFSAYMGLKELSYEHFYRDVRHLLVYRNYTHNEFIEIVWTIIPASFLILIAIPSFTLLYAMDEVIDVIFVVKIIGYQWFWSYEYSGGFVEMMEVMDESEHAKYFFKERTLTYSSVMLNEEDLWFGGRRLLEVDFPLVLPEGVYVRLIVTSGDVLHSWALPNFGIKIDAVPGRLSQVSFYSYISGLYYGQCSELCGVGHGFMPISVWVLPEEKFFTWWWQILEEVMEPEADTTTAAPVVENVEGGEDFVLLSSKSTNSIDEVASITGGNVERSVPFHSDEVRNLALSEEKTTEVTPAVQEVVVTSAE